MPNRAFTRIDPKLELEIWPDFPDSEVSSGTRASIGRLLVDDTKTTLRIGVWEAEANLGRWVHWPCHEFMVILEGEVVMVEEDRETIIGPGECFYIPKGRRCIWNQAGYARKIMVIFDGPADQPDSGTVPIGKIDPNATLSPIAPPPASLLLSAPPQQEAQELYRDPSGQFTIGIWQSTGYARRSVVSPRHEVMHILEGDVTLSDATGTTQTFGPGETILVARGAANAWTSSGPLRKIYCSYEPRA